MADYMYSKFNKNDWITIEGKIEIDGVTITNYIRINA